MSYGRRNILSRGSKIVIDEIEYNIIGVLGEGASVVTYIAKSSDGNVGYIKEFYPRETIDFCCRDEIKNTIHCNNELFSDRLNRYRKKIDELNSLRNDWNKDKNQNNKNQKLNNFFDYTVPRISQDSLYTWIVCPNDGILYQEFLNSIIRNPVSECEDILLTILKIIRKVAEPILLLNDRGYIFTDITPRNFIIGENICSDEDKEVNPGDIKIIDFNSIQKINDDELISGTNGFTSPEVRSPELSLTIQSDIYSLGALLYYSIIINEYEKGYKFKLYTDDDFTDIEKNVKNSALFKDSEINSSESIVNCIVRILRKSLRWNDKLRYRDCNEFIVEVRSLISLLNNKIEEVKSKTKNYNNTLRNINYTSRLQLLLHDFPLFFNFQNDNYDKSKEYIDVFVVGDDDICFKFVDLVLQCQIPTKLLRIHLIGNKKDVFEADNEDRYYSNRDGLRTFLNRNDDEEKYAELYFYDIDLYKDNTNKYWKENLREQLSDLFDEIALESVDYTFISISDNKGYEVIEMLKKEFESIFKLSLFTCCGLWDKNTEEAEKYPGIIRVNLLDNRTNLYEDEGFADLEKLAFNAHLVWTGKSMSLSERDDEYYNFIKDRYNYNSSLGFALSIPYKLFYVLGEKYSSNSIRNYVAISDLLTDEEIVNKIAYSEHKRWVMHYLVEGWSAPYDIDTCISQTLKEVVLEDNSVCWEYKAKLPNNTHGCLVDAKYSDDYFRLKNYDPNADEIDIDVLDDLDRFSVELFRKAKSRLAGIVTPKEIKFIDYKKYDIDLIKEIPNIIQRDNEIGRYAFVPKMIPENDSYNPDSETIDAFFQWLIGILYYDNEMRYAEVENLANRRVTCIKRSAELSEEEREKIRRYMRRLASVIDIK